MKNTSIAKPGGGAWTVPLKLIDDDVQLITGIAPLLGDAPKRSGASGGGKSSSGSVGGGGSAQPVKTDAEVLQGYYDTLKGVYTPEALPYTEQSIDEITAEIAAWLRPGYDAAIARRQKLTDAYHAELDADAIARGMGGSTYVTDVKSRQKDAEAEDILLLESGYSASLAKYVSDAVEAERARSLEVRMFNSEREHAVYMQAYQTALGMFAAYKAGGSSGRGSSGGGGSSKGGAAAGIVTTTPENCERFVAGLSSQQKYNIMTGASELDQQYRAELIASVGSDRYWELISGR